MYLIDLLQASSSRSRRSLSHSNWSNHRASPSPALSDPQYSAAIQQYFVGSPFISDQHYGGGAHEEQRPSSSKVIETYMLAPTPPRPLVVPPYRSGH